MKPRQSRMPRRWLIADARLGGQLWSAVMRLPRGSGVLVLLHELPRVKREATIRSLRYRTATRSILVIDDAKEAARVHNVRELRQAMLARKALILLSPLHVTRSHPDWRPIAPMRAAAHARLANRRLVALGGMDEPRLRRIERLGFVAWAGIDAWLSPGRSARWQNASRRHARSSSGVGRPCR